MKYLKWLTYATKVHKTKLSNFTKNEIVLHPKHGVPPHFEKSMQTEEVLFRIHITFSIPWGELVDFFEMTYNEKTSAMEIDQKGKLDGIFYGKW